MPFSHNYTHTHTHKGKKLFLSRLRAISPWANQVSWLPVNKPCQGWINLLWRQRPSTQWMCDPDLCCSRKRSRGPEAPSSGRGDVQVRILKFWHYLPSGSIWGKKWKGARKWAWKQSSQHSPRKVEIMVKLPFSLPKSQKGQPINEVLGR